jgi:serine/threonine-protein kinase
LETWAPGVVIGQYSLLKELARGGMGEIWLARQTGAAGFDRLVVLKRVINSADEDPANVTMFLDEARIASQLHHPNIVQVFELGQDGTSYYLVMEYLAGQTVSRFARRVVDQHAQVPSALAVQVVAPAARGLGYAHRRTDLEGRALQIVHRDVSPQNLFVTYDGQVKVLDFGIARAAGRMNKTSTGIIRGKVSYMPPEQAVGEPVSGASDVFSLGVVLLELVTGRRAYGTGLDEMAILRKLAAYEELPRASQLVTIDPDLDAIIAQAVDPVRDNRFPDGQAFADALERWSRTHVGRDEPTLETRMHQLFAPEVAALGEFHKLAARTPSASSMPNNLAPRAQPEPPPPPPRNLRRNVLLGAGAAVVLTATWFAGSMRATPPPPVAPLDQRPVTTPVTTPTPVKPPPSPVDDPRPTGDPPVATHQPVTGDTEHPAPNAVDAGAPVKAVASGRLTLDTEPWTQVFLGKRKLGDTPLIELALPAGTHRLHLVNAEDHVDTVVEVVIKPNATTVKKLAGL